MFQKSFQILTVCALATLAAIVGYAALRLNGPEDTLARAEAKFAAGRFGEVVSDLQLAQRGARFARSPELQARLWRLRYQAYSELDDPRSALTDLQLLLEQVGDDERFLIEETTCHLVLHNGAVIAITLPAHVTFRLVQCDPAVKGNTASAITKNATIETGAVIQVPGFLKEGELIKIDSRTGEYVERVKE